MGSFLSVLVGQVLTDHPGSRNQGKALPNGEVREPQSKTTKNNLVLKLQDYKKTVYISLKELGYCSEGRLLGKTQVQHNVRKSVLQGKLYSAASMAKENSSDGVCEDQVNVTVSWPNSVMEYYYLLPSKTL